MPVKYRSGWKLGKTKKKTISLPEDLVVWSEKVAEDNRISWNDLIGRLLSQYRATKGK